MRYSARDLAAVWGRQLGIPVIFGSATPSLESLHHGLSGRYQHFIMKNRAIAASQMPKVELLNPNLQAQGQNNIQASGDLHPEIIQRLHQALDQGQQALVFLNRRGYAPSLRCGDCGWVMNCANCSAPMTLHKQPRQLRCHHCEYRSAPVSRCPVCHSTNLQLLGQGTERIEEI